MTTVQQDEVPLTTQTSHRDLVFHSPKPAIREDQ